MVCSEPAAGGEPIPIGAAGPAERTVGASFTPEAIGPIGGAGAEGSEDGAPGGGIRFVA